VVKPGLRSFEAEWKRRRVGELDNVPVRILPLSRVIASKRAANRDKDVAVLPVLQRTLRVAKRMTKKGPSRRKPRSRRKN